MSIDLPGRGPGMQSIRVLSVAIASVIAAMALAQTTFTQAHGLDRTSLASLPEESSPRGGAWVSPEYVRVLGVGPALERAFVPEHGQGDW